MTELTTIPDPAGLGSAPRSLFDGGHPSDATSPGFGVACDPHDPVHRQLWNHHVEDLAPSGGRGPAPATPQPGRAALERPVKAVEVEVASLGGNQLDRQAAPDVAVTGAAARIAAALGELDAELARGAADPIELNVLAQRLDLAIGTLYVVSRRHRIPMRETHLEEVFDLEDKIRKSYTAYGPTNRADAYYDADLIPINHTTAQAPDAATLATELETGTGGGEPRNRDELAQDILGFAYMLESAIGTAFEAARTAITEPSAPRRPSVVEALAEAAIDTVAAMFNVALGNAIGAGLKSLRAATGIEEHIGKELSDVIHDGLKLAGKDNVKLAGKTLVDKAGHVAAHQGNSGLSPRSLYLDGAQAETSAKVAAIKSGFMRHAGTLKRVPIDTLVALSDKLNASEAISLGTAFEDTVIHEWISFGKAAAEQGEDVRDPKDRPAHASKLDNFLSPYGVVHVRVHVDRSGKASLASATLPGVTTTVLQHVRNEQAATLGTLSLHRYVDVLAANDGQISPGGFALDPAGRLTADPARIPMSTRAVWARLGGRPVTEPVNDTDILHGMQTLVSWLGAIGASSIEAGDA